MKLLPYDTDGNLGLLAFPDEEEYGGGSVISQIDELLAIGQAASQGQAYGLPVTPIYNAGQLATVTVKIPPDPNAPKPPEKSWEQTFDEWGAKLKEKPEYMLIGVAVLVLLLKR